MLMELPELQAPDHSQVIHLLLAYVIAGCVIGFLEYTIAKVVLRGHPREKVILRRGVFTKCILANAVAWPGILVWLALVGFLKTMMLIIERRKGR